MAAPPGKVRLAAVRSMPSATPGRTCPSSYRYGAAALASQPSLQADTLWVAGGVYGNPLALEHLIELYEAERGTKALVFNGDFHWFDIAPATFSQVDSLVARYLATRGNVETELALPEAGAGCGCGYPEWVGEAEVERSNRIIERLGETASAFPASLARLAALPMHLVAEVGGERVGVVHGDAESLAGWGFAQEALSSTSGLAAARASFDAANVAVFASSHTCLPVLQAFGEGRALINNGAAGMPNFRGTTFGLASRISTFTSKRALYRVRLANIVLEAVPLEYDADAWQRLFLAQWPSGSEAHASYFARITNGPRYEITQALRSETTVAA